MCVITVVETERPTDEQVCQMFEANKHGAGAAWVEGAKVFWQKGLDLAEVLKLNRELPMPYILHFRVPSHGTMTGPHGCHPFPIQDDASTDLEGETESGVLFHNGMWNSWKAEIKDIALRGHHKLPMGGWTDSRALAWAAHHMGVGYLDLVDEKVAVLLPNNIHLFGAGWTSAKIGENGSMFVSNKGWERSTTYNSGPHYHQQRIASLGGSTTEGTGGSSRQGSFQGPAGRVDGPLRQAGDRQEGTQQGSEKVVEGSGEGVEEKAKSTLAILLPPGRSVCCKCGSTKRGQVVDGKCYCFQCWAIHKPKEIADDENYCDECYVHIAYSRKCEGDTYICDKCWKEKGYPSIYFGPKTLEDKARDAKKKLHDRGFMPFLG